MKRYIKPNSRVKRLNTRYIGFYELFPSERFLVKSSSQIKYHYEFENKSVHLRQSSSYRIKPKLY